MKYTEIAIDLTANIMRMPQQVTASMVAWSYRCHKTTAQKALDRMADQGLIIKNGLVYLRN